MFGFNAQGKYSHSNKTNIQKIQRTSENQIAKWACIDAALDTVLIVSNPNKCHGTHAYEISNNSPQKKLNPLRVQATDIESTENYNSLEEQTVSFWVF